ncbi:MAG TPA: ComF family protein [Anaerolineales bacterium]|nr:ComF family protein [Anaerolineales bacterium]
MAAEERVVYRLYRNLWATLDLLYPPDCAGCRTPRARWCSECQGKVQVIKPPLCERCGQPLESGRLCVPCQGTTLPCFTAVRSWALFEGPVRQAVHRLKYFRDVSIGLLLAQPLIACLRAQAWQVDLVVPVPLGVARLKERGYNQSGLIARPLGLACGIKYSPPALRRVRETCSQVGLTHAQRRENVRGAFQALSRRVADKSVLIVDDVATSSATLDACAQACLEAGALRVFGLTLARVGQRGVDPVDYASVIQGG